MKIVVYWSLIVVAATSLMVLSASGESGTATALFILGVVDGIVFGSLLTIHALERSGQLKDW